MVLPIKLVPFYPFPKDLYPFDLPYIISIILVLAITGGCLWAVKQGKYLFFTVWLYYVVTLLPVLGIIQVGSQAAADRYSYLPSIGPFFLLGIGIAWIWEKAALLKGSRLLLGGLIFVFTVITLSSLGWLTVNQIQRWQSSEILWRYVIKTYPGKILVAHNPTTKHIK
jgi:hypothetical protein